MTNHPMSQPKNTSDFIFRWIFFVRPEIFRLSVRPSVVCPSVRPSSVRRPTVRSSTAILSYKFREIQISSDRPPSYLRLGRLSHTFKNSCLQCMLHWRGHGQFAFLQILPCLRRTSIGRPTYVRRTSNESPMDVRQMSDGRPTDVRPTSV